MATIPNPAKSRTWDLGTSANGTFFDTEFNQLYANDNNLDGRVEALEGAAKYAKLSDTKAAGTDGGTATSGSFFQRTLNTEDVDSGSIVTLTSNRFTLQAGTYRIKAIVPACATDGHVAKLYNYTDSADVANCVGSAGYAEFNGFFVTTHSVIAGQFTIAGAKEFEILHRVNTTRATSGCGKAANLGVSEVYAVVEIWKVG